MVGTTLISLGRPFSGYLAEKAHQSLGHLSRCIRAVFASGPDVIWNVQIYSHFKGEN